MRHSPTPAFAAAPLLALLFALPLGAADSSYTERVDDAHADDQPSPNAEAGYEGIETGPKDYATVDDDPISGYLARPKRGEPPYPAVLLIHEWWGLNDNMRAMARRLAQAGYVALAVDLYAGETAQKPDQARALMQQAMEQQARLERNLEQAFFYLDLMPTTGKIASIGWCFGGGWSLRTALMLPQQLDASVIYYGELVTDPDRLAKLEVPLLGLFGSEDSVVAPERVRQFDQVLEELGKPHEIHLYEGAAHAFANPSGEAYKPAVAEQAWEETMDFLDQHLQD